MKKNLHLFTILLTLFGTTFVGCNNDDVSTIDPDRVVRFLTGEKVLTLEESSTIYEIPVTINYTFDAPVRVGFELEGNTSLIEVVSEDGFAVIPAGKQVGSILLRVIDNTTINETQEMLTLRLISGNAGFGLPDDLDIGFEEKQLLIIDNDVCPNFLDEWVGSLNAEDVGFGAQPATGSLDEENCFALFITGNLPNSQAGLTPSLQFIFTELSPGKGKVVCPLQVYGAGATYEAEGTFDVSTGEIEVYYLFKEDNGTLIYDGTNIITKN